MNVIRCGVSNFVIFSRTEVLRGDGSVNVFEVFFTFLSVISGFEKMMLVYSLLLKIVAFMFLGGSEYALRLCRVCLCLSQLFKFELGEV